MAGHRRGNCLLTDLLRHDGASQDDQLALVALAASVRAVRLVALQRHAHAVVATAGAARVAAAARRRRRLRRCRREGRGRIQRQSGQRPRRILDVVTGGTHRATIDASYPPPPRIT